jgi:16S rRNA (uracil1498-N3)-methyltransferase
VPYFFGERSGDRVTISGADARHLSQSLRARPGQTIAVLEPPSRLLTVRLEAVSRALITGVVVDEAEHQPEPVARITIAAAMLPATALELLLARCTEAGAAGFILVNAERSIARGAKPERWVAICREAAMLAGRFSVPEVRGPISLREAWSQAVNPYLLDRCGQASLAQVTEPSDVTLFIGPEGGWTETELSIAEGCVVRLGRRNMRAETAAIAAVAIALAGRGD